MNWILRNWLIAAAWLVALSLLGSYLSASGDHPVGAMVLALGWGAVVVAALVDGGSRALGRTSFLGRGRGMGRALAVIQIGLALALLWNLVGILI